MIVDNNKALAVRFFEALDTGNIGVLQNIFQRRLRLSSGRFN